MFYINNLPTYAKNYAFIVVREIFTEEGIERWFYGAWNDRNTANEVALEVGGVTLHAEDVEG